ncbi:MAG TPA: universal stress protein [Polyangiaceae bacterium]
MIICGIDFSAGSTIAASAAAALCAKQDDELLLVTVVQSDQPSAKGSAEMQLEHEAAELHRRYHIEVATRVAHGTPEVELLELAQTSRARLLVVGASGGSRLARRLGSVPEGLCRASTLPVLIARNGSGIQAWSTSAKPLKVLLGSGLGDASACALRYVASWPDIALTLAHVAWPYGEHYRLGVGQPMPLDHLRPEVHRQLIGDLGRWASEAHVGHTTKLAVIPGWGRVDAHLAQLAHEKEADLLVVGNHRRNLVERIWHGSISRNAIHEASCDVLCVPMLSAPSALRSAPQSVVVPTDFSLLADRAVSVGYSLLAGGGVLHLIHVVTDAHADRGLLLEQLKARVPAQAAERGLCTELKLIDGASPWLTIWQYASRANADLICLGSHSRDASASLVLGSQAQALLQHSRVPVVLVPPDREG